MRTVILSTTWGWMMGIEGVAQRSSNVIAVSFRVAKTLSTKFWPNSKGARM